MKTITAFKCSFCGKVYENNKSCKSHEYKCYFNPRTKSCASCSFLKLESRYYKPGYFTNYQACLVNINLQEKGLQTECKKYLDTKYSDDKGIMDSVLKGYDFKIQFISLIEKHPSVYV